MRLIANHPNRGVNLPPIEAEALYRSYLANTVEGIWRLETESPIPVSLPEDDQTELILRDGYVAEANQAYARMHGFATAEQMTGRWLRELLGRAGPQSLELVRTFVRSGYRLVETELCLEVGRGAFRWFSVNLTGIVEQGRLTRAWGSQRDVTLRQRQIAREWQATFDAIRDPVMVVDGNHRVVRANQAALALLRLPLSDVVGRYCHALLHGIESPLTNCPVARALVTRQRAEAEFHWPGRGIWLHLAADPILGDDGRVTHLVHTFSDITERKASEAAVDRLLRFERLISGISARLMQAPTDQVNAELREALRRISEFLGLDRASLLAVAPDQSSVALVESFTTPGCTAPVSEQLDGMRDLPWVFGHVVRHGQCFLAPSLQDLPAEAELDRATCLAAGIRSLLAIPLSASAAVGYVITGVAVQREHNGLEEYIPRLRLMGDILVNALARQEAEAEAQKLRDQLAHVARAAALGELVAALAHELNQPLTAILSNAQAAQRRLASGGGDPSEFQEILADIVADGLRAGTVIRRVRSSLKKGPWQPHPLDVNGLVREVARMVRNEALLRQVTLDLDLATDLPSVDGDAIQLQQVLLNLIANAMDALESLQDGGRFVRISTQEPHPGWVEVAVRDQGTGIPAERLEGVFEPFYTTKPGGLGMGLSICRSIVQAHHGTIAIANNPEGGATVRFTLPASKEPAP